MHRKEELIVRAFRKPPYKQGEIHRTVNIISHCDIFI